MKRCIKCGAEKPLSEFTRRAASGDGLQARCKACLKASRNPNESALWYVRHKESVRARHEQYYKNNKKTISESVKRYQQLHRERLREAARRYRGSREEFFRTWMAKWAVDNREDCYTRRRERTAMQRAATPKWANRFFISEAYRLARLRTKTLGFEWNVDHIVPLKSLIVCGLHYEQNLQVIPSTVNRMKHNRHWPDMPAPL